MAYQSWSVVFGEQPSAAKWNILGSNDASFNDGTGIADGAITSPKLAEAFARGRRQDDNNNTISDSTVTGLTIQYGWGQAAGNSGTRIQEAVTFNVAYSSPPIVIAGALGVDNSSPPAATISDLNLGASSGPYVATAHAISTTGFTMSLIRSINFSGATDYYGYSWIAIGTV